MVIRSIEDFKKVYYPKHFKKLNRGEIEDLETLGAHMANSSLVRINRLLD